MNKHHAIEEQHFDIHFSNEPDAFEQQEILEAFVKQRLLPIIDSVFDEISGSEQLIRIDSIALDLGSVPYDDYEAETERRLREQLKNELLAYKHQIKAELTPLASSVSMQDWDLELLEKFLGSGYLPWSAGSGSNLDLAMQLQGLLEKQPRALKMLLKTAGKREIVVRRLVKQFSIEQLESLLGLFAPKRSRAAISLCHEFRILLQAQGWSTISEPQLNEIIWTELLIGAIQFGPGIAVNDSLVQAWLIGVSVLVEYSYLSLLWMFWQTAREPVNRRKISVEMWDILQRLDATKVSDAALRQVVPEQSVSQAKYTRAEDSDGSKCEDSVNDYEHYLNLKRRLIDTALPQQAESVRLNVSIKRIERYAPWLLLRLAQELKMQLGFGLHNFDALLPEELEQLLKSLSVIFGIESGRELANFFGFTQNKPDKTQLYARVLEKLIINGEDGFDTFIDALQGGSHSHDNNGENKIALRRPTEILRDTSTDLHTRSKHLACLEQYLNQATSLEQRSELLKSLLRPALATHRSVSRLIDLVSEVALVRSLALLGVHNHAELLRCAESAVNLFRALDVGTMPADIDGLKWQFIARYLFDESRTFKQQTFIRGLMVYLSERTGIQTSALVQALKLRSDLDRLPEMRRLRQPVLDALLHSKSSPDMPSVVRSHSTPRGGDGEEAETSENIYIHNAGLVLTAPYIPRLLEMLNLTANSEFKSRSAAERGIHLLQYLVNGSCNSPEYQLVLNKILCGVTTGTPIVRELTMDDNEAAVVATLLQAIIEHWQAIGNTSIEGLQESFLQREGRLRLKNDSWHLLVEARAFDMLLDRLPWSFSLIKFPWMQRPLYVEWR